MNEDCSILFSRFLGATRAVAEKIRRAWILIMGDLLGAFGLEILQTFSRGQLTSLPEC